MPERIFDMLGAAKLDIFGITVICDGEVILHKAFGEDIRRPVYSATKSVTSAAFCLACDDGLISADSLLCEFLENHFSRIRKSIDCMTHTIDQTAFIIGLF